MNSSLGTRGPTGPDILVTNDDNQTELEPEMICAAITLDKLRARDVECYIKGSASYISFSSELR